MRWYERIIAAHTSVTDKVSHGGRLKSDRYFVWMEDSEKTLTSDNVHSHKAVTGSTDLFTKIEFDAWIDQIEMAFDASPYIFWYLNSVQYEEDTGFWHYEWRWDVIDG